MHECNAHVYVSTQFVYLNYEMLHPSPLKTKLRPRSSRSSPYWEMERTLTNLIHNGTLLPTASTIEDISCSNFILRFLHSQILTTVHIDSICYLSVVLTDCWSFLAFYHVLAEALTSNFSTTLSHVQRSKRY